MKPDLSAVKRSNGHLNWTPDAVRAVLHAHREGATLTGIGRELGVSCERIRQVVAKAKRRGM